MTRILLYNDECAVCRTIARWVIASGLRNPILELDVRPIGDDPARLRALNADLDIWSAYATIHLLMPDGSMKTGDEAVAEVFRTLPNTRWFTGLFAIALFGVRPFQLVLDAGYEILADVRPLLGCESCGTKRSWLRPIHRASARVHARLTQRSKPKPHFSRAKDPITGALRA
jgi:predicted DCC family thiol-disulfide oxidoreductase YuxK